MTTRACATWLATQAFVSVPVEPSAVMRALRDSGTVSLDVNTGRLIWAVSSEGGLAMELDKLQELRGLVVDLVLFQPHALVRPPLSVMTEWEFPTKREVKAEIKWLKVQAAQQRAEWQQAAWDKWFERRDMSWLNRQETLQARLKDQARMLGLGEWFVKELQWIQREMNRTWKYDQWEATETRQQTRPKPRRPQNIDLHGNRVPHKCILEAEKRRKMRVRVPSWRVKERRRDIERMRARRQDGVLWG